MNVLRILVVEDESLVARDLQATLEQLGYEVTGHCRTGVDALEAVGLQHPDLVLMDIRLGDTMDGIETAGRIQAEHGTPVVFLTAYADEGTLARARGVEPYGYLLKPFHPSELRSVVELAVSRFRVDRRLRDSEERFAATLRSVADGVISTDVMGTITFMNPTAEALTGWQCREAAGHPLREVFRVSQPDGGEVAQQVNGALRTILLTNREGESFPIEDNTAPIRDAQGSLTGIVVLFRRKIADLPAGDPLPAADGKPVALSPEQASAVAAWPSLAGIVGSISDPLLALDRQWRITYLNDLAAHTLESPRDTLLGEILWDRLPPTLHVRYYHEFSSALVRRQPRSFEMEHEARGMWYEVQLYPFGEGLLALLRDITARKVAEEQQNKLEKLESLGLLARGFAHDFNNLLTVLMGNLSLAEMRLAPDAPAREELRTARLATTQAQNLVQQLLTFARGGAPIKQATDFGGLVRDWFAEWPRRDGIDYQCSIGEGLWHTEVDRNQMRRLLGNLLRNSEESIRDSSGTRGRIELRVARAAEAGMRPSEVGLPSGTALDSWLVVEISDNGHGIPPDVLPRVFEPYFTTRQDSNASGLGLTVCESIAKAHGAALRLGSMTGEGTTVRLCLPAPLPGESLDPAPLKAEPGSGPSGNRRVLILEDEPLIRQLIVRNLESAGCEVTPTADGQETVDRYRQACDTGAPYDLLVMDLSIPGGMGGAQAMEQILRIDPAARAIVSSGYNDDPVMSRYLDYGFRAVLPKPYQPQELRSLVEEMLAEQR